MGCGGIGGLAGFYMARAGEHVVFIDQNAEHVRAIRERGISINGVYGPQAIGPQRASTPDEIPELLDGLVFLACKSQHTANAASHIMRAADRYHRSCVDQVGVQLTDCVGSAGRQHHSAGPGQQKIPAAGGSAGPGGHPGRGRRRGTVYRKRKSEAAYLTVTCIADQFGVKIPLNERLSRMIEEIEDGRRALGWHNVDELAANAETLGEVLP